MLDNPITPQTLEGAQAQAATIATIRLLISHNLMGTIIGRQGTKIKHIQDVSGARMVANKEMLPQSTERVVDVQGMVDSIRVAVWEIGKCLIEDAERGAGTVHYTPAARLTTGIGMMPSFGATGYMFDRAPFARIPRTGNGIDFARPLYETAHYDPERDPYFHSVTRTQHISIPTDYVGCIIGKGGTRISEIRQLSGCRISIAKPSEDSNERMFTLTGVAEANEKALYLIYHQLEMEKQRRQRAGTLIGEEEQ
jgi:heterogeneous nuclear rnp K-like protein 2